MYLFAQYYTLILKIERDKNFYMHIVLSSQHFITHLKALKLAAKVFFFFFSMNSVSSGGGD